MYWRSWGKEKRRPLPVRKENEAALWRGNAILIRYRPGQSTTDKRPSRASSFVPVVLLSIRMITFPPWFRKIMLGHKKRCDVRRRSIYRLLSARNDSNTAGLEIHVRDINVLCTGHIIKRLSMYLYRYVPFSHRQDADPPQGYRPRSKSPHCSMDYRTRTWVRFPARCVAEPRRYLLCAIYVPQIRSCAFRP